MKFPDTLVIRPNQAHFESAVEQARAIIEKLGKRKGGIDYISDVFRRPEWARSCWLAQAAREAWTMPASVYNGIVRLHNPETGKLSTSRGYRVTPELREAIREYDRSFLLTESYPDKGLPVDGQRKFKLSDTIGTLSVGWKLAGRKFTLPKVDIALRRGGSGR